MAQRTPGLSHFRLLAEFWRKHESFMNGLDHIVIRARKRGRGRTTDDWSSKGAPRCLGKSAQSQERHSRDSLTLDSLKWAFRRAEDITRRSWHFLVNAPLQKNDRQADIRRPTFVKAAIREIDLLEKKKTRLVYNCCKECWIILCNIIIRKCRNDSLTTERGKDFSPSISRSFSPSLRANLGDTLEVALFFMVTAGGLRDVQ